MLFAQIQTINNETRNNWWHDGWAVKANLSAVQFHGDISEKSFFGKLAGETRLGYSFAISKDLTSKLFLEARIRNSKMYSSQEFLPDNSPADMHFNADVFEHAFLLGFDLSSIISGANSNQHYRVYGGAGIGLAHWNSTLYQTTTGSVIATSGFGEGNGLWQRANAIMIPITLGIDYHLFNNVWLNIETSVNIANSDLLDVRTVGSRFDTHSHTAIGICYRFGVESLPRRGTGSTGHRVGDRRGDIHADHPSILDFPGFALPESDRPQETEVTIEQEPIAERRRELIPFQPADAISGGGTMPRFDPASPAPMPGQQLNRNQLTIVGGGVTTVEALRHTPGAVPTPDGAFFSVQIKAARQPSDIRAWIATYQLEYPVMVVDGDGLIRFTTGAFENHANAIVYQQVLRARGISDAFVIAINNGVRVPLATLKGR